jgi:GH24 family phage-related lysozyme (muramidase)
MKFIDAVKYHKDLPHQNNAWEFLQSSVSKEILDEFARLYRNEKTTINLSNIPKKGLELIKEFEDFSPTAYYDPLTGNLPITIGWGSTRNFDGKPFKITDKINTQNANLLLEHQLKNEFLPALQKIPYWDEMTEHQKGALLSFAYNLGADFYGHPDFGTITRVLKNKEWSKVPEALKLYRNPGTNVEAGLLRRRIAEGELWKK